MEKTEKKDTHPENGSKTLARLKALYDFMAQHGLETLEVADSEGQARLVRAGSQAPVQIVTAANMAAVTAGPSPASVPTAPAAPVLPPGAVTVKAPMMGIFYRAPSPSSPPYVKEGDKVAAGHVLCMVEAMKVFNEIKAEFPGTVLTVLVENGKAVKSGQDLFVVQRA
ncbi:MAG: acetyl-CoA carboxylase biotin carboxyl carrier protein [Elusimicrobia bacterium]|nr:acetyl-CoA carboxylase biotin carboxyl carrier protein [Elusimicrobiota bacterium]